MNDIHKQPESARAGLAFLRSINLPAGIATRAYRGNQLKLVLAFGRAFWSRSGKPSPDIDRAIDAALGEVFFGRIVVQSGYTKMPKQKKVKRKCYKCQGEGFLAQYDFHHGGECFTCDGTGFVTFG